MRRRLGSGIFVYFSQLAMALSPSRREFVSASVFDFCLVVRSKKERRVDVEGFKVIDADAHLHEPQ